MTTNQILTGLITFIIGGGLTISIQRAVRAYRDVKGGRLADTGTVVDMLERENVRLRTRLDEAEADADAEVRVRRATEVRAARLELQLVRAGIEPEGHADDR